jgi:pyruvate,water dikinase
MVGGKAAALDRLISAGVRVPSAAVLTVDAYRAFVAQPRLAEVCQRLADQHEPSAGLDTAPIDRAFLQAPMPQTVRRAVCSAGRLVRAAADGSTHLVVRSSATAEDLDAASFAGQYRSVLNVDDDAGLLRAVRLVWASLWYPAPRAYRRLRGLDDRDLAMAVLVMAQVDARTSGVVFTIDPSGHPGCARVELVEGLADRLVSGAVTPSAFVVPRGPPGPGVPTEAAAALTAALAVADATGVPQDVEWVHDGQHLWIVQARPITTATDRPRPDDGFDSRIDESATYTTSGIAEAVPGVLPPLAFTTAGALLDEALHELLDRVGARPADSSGPLVVRLRGRAVLDFSRLATAVETLPSGLRDELDEQYFASAAVRPAKVRYRATHRQALRVVQTERRAAHQAQICIRAIDEVVDDPLDISAMTNEELLRLHSRLLDLAGRTATAQAIVAAGAAASQARLQTLLGGWYDQTPASELAQSVITGLGDAGALNGIDVSGLSGVDLTRAADRAGSMAYFGGPTWAENLDMAAVAADTQPIEPSDALVALEDIERDLAARRSWRITRVLTGQVIDVRLSLLRRTVAETRTSLARREHTKAALLRLGGLVRRIHLEMGRRLSATGVLALPTDVILLGLHELAPAFAGRAPSRLELLLRRRTLAEAEATGPLPHVFTGHPHSPIQAQECSWTYSGWGAGPGVAEGPARVVSTPAVDALGDGDVLVAHSTDASWSPLFLKASALVVEEGGPLSHAAICARELGLPAVVNIPGIVERLGTGRHRVRVDGRTGTVTLLDPPAGTPASSEHPDEQHDGRAERASPLPGLPRTSSRGDVAEALDDLDGLAAPVFVPAIMGVGVVFSLVVGVTSLLQRVLRAPGTDRRSRLLAHQAAMVAAHGERAARADRAGLFGQRSYALLGLALMVLGVYIGIGQIANYLRVGSYAWHVAAMLAVTLMCTLCFEVAGVTTMAAALAYDRPSAVSRAFLASTLLMRSPTAGGGQPRFRPATKAAKGPPPSSATPQHSHIVDDLDRLAMSATWHRRLRWLARVLSVVVLVGTFAVSGQVSPRNPQFATFQGHVLAAILVVFGVAVLVALRWEGLGGAVMLVCATFLGVLAATEYSPTMAFVLFATLAAPAVLHLLGWQRTRSLAAVLTVLALTATLAAAGGVAAYELHAFGFGPTHPQSVAANPPVDVVQWTVAGGTTSSTATVKTRLADPTDEAYLLVDDDPGLSQPRRFGPVPATAQTDRVATFTLSGLEPGRTYHYAVEADGRVETARSGRVTTFPDGPASFTFAFASCAQTGSNGSVFDAIRELDPLFFVATGDLYYGDVSVDDPSAFAELFTTTWSSPGQSALYRSTSLVYTWDDHDYDGNDADRTAPSRPAALEAYRTYVPHYPFAQSGSDAPVAQAFTVGRVRVVLTDLRSARSPVLDPDGPEKSMLGEDQREWLLREITESSRTHAVVVWVSSAPWIIPESPGNDSWGGYAAERQLIADALDAADVTNLLMLAGDAHMVAIDDGSHNTFSSDGEPMFPVFHAAPLDRPPGTKGGPYSEGQSAEPGQFGVVQVLDDGADVTVSLTGRSWRGAELPVSWTWQVPDTP